MKKCSFLALEQNVFDFLINIANEYNIVTIKSNY